MPVKCAWFNENFAGLAEIGQSYGLLGIPTSTLAIFLWGYMTQLVYQALLDTVEQLKHRFQEVATDTSY